MGVSKNRKVGRWFLGETLGKGGYSWVKKGYDRKDGRVVALKFTSKAKGDWSASQSKQIQNEIEALRQIKDKHVLQLLAYNLNDRLSVCLFPSPSVPLFTVPLSLLSSRMRYNF